MVLIFRGHYSEKPVAFSFSAKGRSALASKDGLTFGLTYRPLEGRWEDRVEIIGDDQHVVTLEAAAGGGGAAAAEVKVADDMHEVD